MSNAYVGLEFFLRLEAYLNKNIDVGKHWALVVDSLSKLCKHVSTKYRTEVYEGFTLTLFHEENLDRFIHMSLHFSGLQSPLVVDSVVDRVLEVSELVEAYLTVKGNIENLKKTEGNVYIEGVTVKISTYLDKGFAIMAYRLFNLNKGMRIASRALSETMSERKGFLSGLRSLLSSKR